MLISVFLIGSAVVFFLLSLTGFVSPERAVAPLELSSASVSARNEIRANYGGMHLAMGLSLSMAGWMPQYAVAGLWLEAVFLAGLLLGRVISMMTDGKPSRVMMGITWFEVIALLACGVVYYLANV